MSNFMKNIYNGGFAIEFSVLMSKEISALVRSYAHETRKEKSKLAEKYLGTW